jgi:hypothetical protein
MELGLITKYKSMKTCADFKRYLSVPGNKVELLYCYGRDISERIKGIREVVKTQTNGTYISTNEAGKKSWLEFPKAKNTVIAIDGKTVNIHEDNGTLALVYRTF